MSPRSVVQAKEGPRSKDAGIVESVEKDELGRVRYAVVKWDSDGKLEEFAADALNVLVAH